MADDSDVSHENISDSSGESFDLRTVLCSKCHNFYSVKLNFIESKPPLNCGIYCEKI